MNEERLAEIEQDVALGVIGMEPGYWADTVHELIAEVRRLQATLKVFTDVVEAQVHAETQRSQSALLDDIRANPGKYPQIWALARERAGHVTK